MGVYHNPGPNLVRSALVCCFRVFLLEHGFATSRGTPQVVVDSRCVHTAVFEKKFFNFQLFGGDQPLVGPVLPYSFSLQVAMNLTYFEQ